MSSQPSLFGHEPAAYASEAGERRLLDAYYTADPAADALVAATPECWESWCLEPSAGGGAFVRALLARGCRVEVRDIDPHASALKIDDCKVRSRGDFLGWTPSMRPLWVVGNPPYADAEAHVRHALSVTRRGVAMLLRLAFLESQQRAPFWAEHPCSWVGVLSKRPSFTGGGTDSAAYGWFVWDREWLGETRLRVLGTT